MNLRIDNTQALSEAGRLDRMDRIDRMDRTIEGGAPAQASEFSSALGKAIGEIDKMQVAADTQADSVARGAGAYASFPTRSASGGCDEKYSASLASPADARARRCRARAGACGAKPAAAASRAPSRSASNSKSLE